MHEVYPSYYQKFKCIGKKCRHNCCIGWEIDIDSDTYEYYKTVGGEMGTRLAKNIDNSGAPHFILGENERCPFLNKNNLCDIIIELGEEHICDICTAHPRFKNEIPGRLEIGIGLTCEEAARIILTEKEKVTLCGATDTDDEIIILRDKVIYTLQNRKKPIEMRISDMLALTSATFPEKSICEWRDVFISLERLDEKWTTLLEMLDEGIEYGDFDRYMKSRETEYEQLLVYFIYRHFANAPDMYEAAARASFAALAYTMIHELGAALFAKNGSFSIDDHIELCRMFSSEIEYSDENIYILLDELW